MQLLKRREDSAAVLAITKRRYSGAAASIHLKAASTDLKLFGLESFVPKPKSEVVARGIVIGLGRILCGNYLSPPICCLEFLAACRSRAIESRHVAASYGSISFAYNRRCHWWVCSRLWSSRGHFAPSSCEGRAWSHDCLVKLMCPAGARNGGGYRHRIYW